jgi:hypothetical protein
LSSQPTIVSQPHIVPSPLTVSQPSVVTSPQPHVVVSLPPPVVQKPIVTIVRPPVIVSLPPTVVQNLPKGNDVGVKDQIANARDAAQNAYNDVTQRSDMWAKLHQNFQADLYRNGSVGMDLSGHLRRQFTTVSVKQQGDKTAQIALINVSQVGTQSPDSSKSVITFNNAVPRSNLAQAVQTAFYSPGTTAPAFYASAYERMFGTGSGTSAHALDILLTGGQPGAVKTSGVTTGFATNFTGTKLTLDNTTLASSQLSYKSAFLTGSGQAMTGVNPSSLPAGLMFGEVYTVNGLQFTGYAPVEGAMLSGVLYNKGGKLTSAPSGL